MSTLGKIWRSWHRPRHAVWLPVWPPLGAFAELVALMVIIHVVGASVTGLDVASLEPSPYWIPVLLLSLQYGTVAGLLAAGAATLFYALGGLPEQAIEENHFTYLLRAWAMPILWIGVALLLGQFRLRQIEIKQRLKTELQQAKAESAGLARYVLGLEKRCRSLERRIAAGDTVSGMGVLDALAEFVQPAATLQASLTAVVKSAFPGAVVGVYLTTPAGLEASLVGGGGVNTAHRDLIPVEHPLYRAIVLERRSVSAINKADEAALAGWGLASVPIFNPESGRVIGMLKLERADSTLVGIETLGRLALIARLAAPLIGEPRIVVDNTERAVTADGVGARLTRGWRQFSWQLQGTPAPSAPSAAFEAGSAERGSDDRPRASK